MIRTTTLLIAALALSFPPSQTLAAPGCCSQSGPAVRKSATTAYEQSARPLGGAAEEVKKAAAGCCGAAACAHAKADTKNTAGCGGAAACAHAKADAPKNTPCCSLVPGGGHEKKTDKAKTEKADKDKAKYDKAKADKKDAERPGKDRAYKVGDTVKGVTATDAKTGQPVTLDSLKGEKATVLIFWNQACPFVVEMQDRAADFTRAHKDNGVNVVAIDAGVNNAVEAIEKYAADKPYALLINRDTTLAAQFGATHTPEVFLLDNKGVIRYHGAFDSGRLRGDEDTRKTYVADAIKGIVKGEKPEVATTRAFGCTIKYADGVKPLTR